MTGPSCFISYSWDHDAHREWVARLADDLQNQGVDVRFDRGLLAGESLTRFMESAVRESDYVLIVCTPGYCKKANKRAGGVGYESQIVSTELFYNGDTLKFIPILRSGSSKTALPTYLQGRLVIDFRADAAYQDALNQLLGRMWVKSEARSSAQRQKAPGNKTERPTHSRSSTSANDIVSASVQEVTDSDFAQVVEAEQRMPVLVEFWAEWCGPCRMVKPIVEDIARSHGDKIKVVRVNVDNEPRVAQKYRIMNIPTFNVHERGDVVKQFVGAKPKTALLRDLSEWLAQPPEEEEGDDRRLEEALGLTLSQGRIRLVKVRSDGTYSFVDAEDAMHGLIYLANSAHEPYASSIQEFEALINDSYTTKNDLVAFLEQNPGFLLSGDYKAARSRIFLTQERRPPLTPDFFLQPVTGELCDILEVQPPQHEIAVSVGGISMLSEVVLEAVSKLNAYRDYFEEDRHRIAVEDQHGIAVFRPRLFVLIGRSGRTDPLTRRKLEGHIGNINLRTWDEVLAIAKRHSRIGD
jgi:thioredoxin 1